MLEDGETPEEAIKRVYKKEEKNKEKSIEELKAEKKQLYQDVLKAKKEGNKELQRKLFDRYNEIDRILKGNKAPKEEKQQEKDTNIKSSKHFEKFDKLKDEADKLQDIWNKKADEYRDKLENDKDYKRLETQQEALQKERQKLNYSTERDKYLALSAAINNIYDKKNKIREKITAEVGLKEAQEKYFNKNSEVKDIQKEAINNDSETIKKQISKISSRNDKLVKSLDTLKNDPYITQKNTENALKNEYENLFEKYRKMEWGTEEYKTTYQQYKEKRAEWEKQYWKSRKMLAEFAPKVSKILQVENGLKFETNAENKAMEENGKRLKEVLNGIIPSSAINNKPINIKQTGSVRASQSGQNINLHNNERIGTIIHETAHQLEENNPKMLMNSLAFAKARTEGEKQKALNKFSSGYKRDEYCKPDKFFDPYCGKLYTLTKGKNRSFVDGTGSEIMSMGLQRIFEDPIRFVKEDREYFDFVISNLRGELWD